MPRSIRNMRLLTSLTCAILTLAIVMNVLRTAPDDYRPRRHHVVTAVSLAAAPTGPCSANSSGPQDTGNAGSNQCIAGQYRNTRGFLRDCPTGKAALAFNAGYLQGDCKGIKTYQAEGVAQSRFIAYENTLQKPSYAPLISPNVQWEVQVSARDRIDAMVYDHDQSNYVAGAPTPVNIVELKLGGIGSAQQGKAEDQAKRYALALKVDPNVYHPQIMQWSGAGYYDQFSIANQCIGTNPVQTRKFYKAESTVDGVIMVQLYNETETQCPKTNPSPSASASASETAEPTEEPEPTIIMPPSASPTATPSDDIPTLVDQGIEEIYAFLKQFALDHNLAGKAELTTGIILLAVAAVILAPELAPFVAGISGRFALIAIVAAFLAEYELPSPANAAGDPHMATLDGRTYEFQTVGEFHLLEVINPGIDIQARTTALNSYVSRIGDVSTDAGGHDIELSDSGVLMDGESFSLPDNQLVELSDATFLYRDDSGYHVTWQVDTADTVMLTYQVGGTVSVAVPPGYATAGLLGDNDGDPRNDLQLSDGTQLSPTSGLSTIYGPFADSWRVTDDESLFTYPAGMSTADYTDKSFPANVTTIDDYAPEEIESASAICRTNGVLVGPAFSDCVYDILLTGDSSYAAAAAAITGELYDPLSESFDAAGNLTEDFTAPVAVNFKSSGYLNDRQTGRVAGPVSDDSPYSFYQLSIPRHDEVDMDLRLFAYGPINSDNLQQSVSVDVDNQIPIIVPLEGDGSSYNGPGSLGLVRSGTTTDGTGFSIYDLKLPLSHFGTALGVTLQPNNFRGALNTALGVGSVSLSLQKPAPQDFTLNLPATVTANAPSTGEGDLETGGAEDDYNFSIPGSAPQSLFVARPSSVNVVLVDSAGNVDKPVENDGNHLRFEGVPAGPATLKVTGTAGPTTYALSANIIPADVTGSVSTDGTPTPVQIATSGQGASIAFRGLAGQRIQVTTTHAQFGSGSMQWNLELPNGSVVRPASSQFAPEQVTELASLPADGTYHVLVNPVAGSTGSVNVRVWTVPDDADPGYYAIDDLPQKFSYNVGEVVSAGSMGQGSGNLEGAHSKDIYAFNFAGGDLYVDHPICLQGEQWVLRQTSATSSLGSIVASGNCTDQQLTGLSSGTYKLTVSGDGSHQGTYGLQLFPTPVVPQDFALPLASTVSQDVPGAGAGNLETKFSVDRYSFHVATAEPLYVDVQQCLTGGDQTWTIVAADGTVEDSNGGCDDKQSVSLQPGDYTLQFAQTNPASSHDRGSYSFQAWLVPLAPQTFTPTLPLTISDGQISGTSTPGAGDLETKASVDKYVFTVPQGKTGLSVSNQSCSVDGLINWELDSIVAGEIIEIANGTCKTKRVTEVINRVAGGQYQLVVSGAVEAHGGYGITVSAGDAAQPVIVHTPTLTAYNGQAIPIQALSECQDSSVCSAQLYYRVTSTLNTTSVLGVTSGLESGGWTAVDMTKGVDTTKQGLPMVSWTATIPAQAVTTTGVDYYIEASDGQNENDFPVSAPGLPLGLNLFTDLLGATASAGSGTTAGGTVLDTPYLHVTTVSPPIVTHLTPLYAYADQNLPLQLQSTCSTGHCTATLHYRTSAGLVPGSQELLGDPGWATITMTQSLISDLGSAGQLLSFAATIPGSKVDTRGVDYYFDVTDGTVTSYWPGTAYQGYYAPRDGMRTGYATVHVLEPPHITHVPPTSTNYHTVTPLTALSNCPVTRTCTATLWYRTTTNTGDVLGDSVLSAHDFISKPMTVTRTPVPAVPGGNTAITVTSSIPASIADTRGIDYYFNVSDGSTTTWYPGTGQLQGYVNLDGLRVGYQHVHVNEPPHITPHPVLTAPALQPYTVTADMSCVTANCSLTLHWRNDLAASADDPTIVNDASIDPGWHTVVMTPTGAPVSTPAGPRQTYTYTIPADQVITAGIAYYLQGYDGYVHAYSPGTRIHRRVPAARWPARRHRRPPWIRDERARHHQPWTPNPGCRFVHGPRARAAAPDPRSPAGRSSQYVVADPSQQ